MATFQPKRINLNEINNGNEYANGDTPSVDSVNAPIEASAYVQGVVDNFKASGDYANNVSYKYPTFVNYQGSGYMCISETAIINIPPTDTTKWKKIVDKGANGTNGTNGTNGSKIVSTTLIGQDAQGGNIYRQSYDDGSTQNFVAPKGDDGTILTQSQNSGAHTNISTINYDITDGTLTITIT